MSSTVWRGTNVPVSRKSPLFHVTGRPCVENLASVESDLLVSASSPAIGRSTPPMGVFSDTRGHRRKLELQHTGSVMVRPQSEHFSCACVSVFGQEVRACLNCVQLLDYSYLRRPETLLWHYVLLLWLPRSCLQQQPRPGYCSPDYEEPLPPLYPRMWRLLASLTSLYRPSKCGILRPEPMNLGNMSRWCCSRKDHILFQNIPCLSYCSFEASKTHELTCHLVHCFTATRRLLSWKFFFSVNAVTFIKCGQRYNMSRHKKA